MRPDRAHLCRHQRASGRQRFAAQRRHGGGCDDHRRPVVHQEPDRYARFRDAPDQKRQAVALWQLVGTASDGLDYATLGINNYFYTATPTDDIVLLGATPPGQNWVASWVLLTF